MVSETRAEQDRKLKSTSLSKGELRPIPSRTTLANGWLEYDKETLYSYDVPGYWRVSSVLLQLSKRATALILPFAVQEQVDGESLNTAVLGVLTSTAAFYRHIFTTSKRGTIKTRIKFAVRLENCLTSPGGNR